MNDLSLVRLVVVVYSMNDLSLVRLVVVVYSMSDLPLVRLVVVVYSMSDLPLVRLVVIVYSMNDVVGAVRLISWWTLTFYSLFSTVLWAAYVPAMCCNV